MQVFNQPIKKLTKANSAFRRELATTSRAQVVLMCLQPGERIGEETHDDTDQFFYIVKGEGHCVVNGELQAVSKGTMLIVPAGTQHDLVNDGGESMRLFTIYVPPHHPVGTLHMTKSDALAAERVT